MATTFPQTDAQDKFKARAVYRLDVRKWALHLEKLIVVVLLVFVSNATFSPLLPNLPVTIWRAAAAGFGLLILWRYLPLLIQVTLTNLPLTLWIGYVGASILWAFAPDASLDPVLWFLLLSVFGLYIAVRFSLEEQFTLFVYAILLAALVSLVFIFLVPSVGVHDFRSEHAGAWKGIFFQKNAFGIFTALAFAHIFLLGQRWGIWRYVMMGILLVAVIGSTSVTALVLCIGTLLVLPGLRVLRLHHTILVGLFLILVPIAVAILLLIAGNFGFIAEALGRDATLTGRTQLWSASLTLIGERPLFGWGLRGAFSSGSPIFNMIDWRGAQFAHNHWIDITLDTGVIGLVLYLAVFIPALLGSLAYAKRKATIESLFPFVFLVFLHIANLTTESLVTMNDFRLVFFIAFSYGLALHSRAQGDKPYQRAFTSLPLRGTNTPSSRG